MPDGTLLLQVMDVHGRPIDEPADVLLQNLALSDTRNLRNLDVSHPRSIPDMNIFPNGLYRLEVDTLSYHTVSRFVNIPPDGNGEVAITLPINPKKVVKANFPAFGDAKISRDAWDLLDRSSQVLNFEGMSGSNLYQSLDDIRKAGFLNLAAKATRTRFTNESDSPSVLSMIGEIVELRGDRFFAKTTAGLRSLTINSIHSELFHEVTEVLHTPPAGFSPARSFKTLDSFGNLQLSFFSNPAGDIRVDMDIDDAQGFDHIFQVIGNFFGGPTHPYNIHEILIASQELDPGYDLLVHEVASPASV